MRGRQLVLSSVLLLLCPAAAHATGYTSRSSTEPRRSSHYDRIEFDLTPDYSMPEISWADSVMMTKLPAGSLIVRYDGPQKVIIKHARSQVRRYARRYRKYSEGAQPIIDVWNDKSTLNAWWTRSWMASMPSSKGGAPDRPYVHTIGKELTWRLGPLTISNMLKVKVDYLAVFKFNPDPGEKTSDRRPPPVSLDVHTAKAATIGTRVRVKVRPNVRVGMPKSSGWLSVIRNITVRAEIDVVIFGIHFLKGDVLLKYKPDREELSLQIGLAVTSW